MDMNRSFGEHLTYTGLTEHAAHMDNLDVWCDSGTTECSYSTSVGML